MLWASIVPPLDDSRYQVNPELAATRLHIDYQGMSKAHRLAGVATQLVAAAEDWGREHGATIAFTDTYAGSPHSRPFWQQRMGHRTRSVILVKALAEKAGGPEPELEPSEGERLRG